MIRVFISHSSADRDLTGLLILLLRLSLGFTSDEIRSTSNNGYQLESGKDPDEALLREAAESELVIALLTPDSMRSPDVANELATRRETGRWLIYLCARGVGPEEVSKRGWRSFALDASDSGQLYKFLEDVADGFGSALEKASSNMNLVNDLASAATRSTEHVDERGNDTVIDRLSLAGNHGRSIDLHRWAEIFRTRGQAV